MELLEEILYPWASITYEDCPYLCVAKAETVRKLRAINAFYKGHRDDDLGTTILDVEISQG